MIVSETLKLFTMIFSNVLMNFAPRCPECDETFMTLVKLHTHAVNCHYYGQMKSLLQPQYKLSKGYCTECQKPTASLQSFMYHMGVKHRVVFAVRSLRKS